MANLKIEIRESIVLDGDSNYNSYNFQSLSGINEVSKRRVTLPNTEQEVLGFGTSVGSGTFVEQDVRYIRITNLSKQWPVMLTFKNDDNDEFRLKLDKQASFIYSGETDLGKNLSGSGVQNSFDADNDLLGTTDNMGDLVNITAYTSASGDPSGSYDEYITAGSGSDFYGRPLPATANVELFVASV